MKRAIVTPPVLAADALVELKEWLAITTASDDAPLTQLLRTAIEMFESFTGLMPLEAACEEILPNSSEWQVLSVRPVQAMTTVETLAPDSTRVALSIEDYAIELDADGSGRVRIVTATSLKRIAVRFTAGMTADWTALPDAVRHGIIRLAADQYRERNETQAGHVPPAAVAALWHPWRAVRLA